MLLCTFLELGFANFHVIFHMHQSKLIVPTRNAFAKLGKKANNKTLFGENYDKARQLILFSEEATNHKTIFQALRCYLSLILPQTANVYRDLRGPCREIGVRGFQNCRVYMYICIQHKQCRCAVYGFCGETISTKSVCNTVQIMWVSHIKLTGKPCILLIFQLISSEFAGSSL